MTGPPGVELGAHLKRVVGTGRKLLVPYLTCGLPDPDGFVELYLRLSEFADAIEVGIPFSDPVMDGAVIQESSSRALAAGITVDRCFHLASEAVEAGSAPAVLMTYFNPVHACGVEAFARRTASSGVSGVIVPDLPYEESGELNACLRSRRIALVQLVAPTTSEERASMLAAASRGWVYAVSRMGVTGEQSALACSAGAVVGRVRPHTDLPVLLGVGISSPELAGRACEVADGVIVGAAVMKRVLAGDLPGAVDLVREMRAAISA